MIKTWALVFGLAMAPFAIAQGPFTRTLNAPFDAGAGPYGGTAADFNGDGIPDLAFAAYGVSSVVVQLGDGKGGFTPAPGSPFPAGSETLTVIAGDFNGDGKLDFAGLSTLAGPSYLGQGYIVVYFGDGLGGFALALSPGFNVRPSQLSRGFPVNFIGADLNRDGKTDIIIQNGNGVWALLSDGAGGFDIAPGSPFAPSSSGIAVADFNRDGKPDVVVSNASDHSVKVYLGDETGRFQAGRETILPDGYQPTTLVAADWNGDGVQDLAAIRGDSGLAILFGDGTGGFQLRSSPGLSVQLARQPFAVGDYNGDGYADLFVSNGASAVLLTGNGNGQFQQTQSFTLGPYLGFLVAADYNRDGKPDIASSTGLVFLNSLRTISLSSVSYQFHAVVNGPAPKPIPLNLPDIPGLVINVDQPWVRLSNSQISIDPVGLTAGHHEAIVRLNAPNYYSILLRVSVDVVVPSGTLTFHSFQPEPLLPLGDFNNDGKPDLLRLDNGSLTISLNDGSANFTNSGRRFPLTLGAGGSASGDFNGDGNLDVAIVGGNGIAVYFGDGSGTLGAGQPTSIKKDVSAFQLIVADVNGDGFADIVTASATQAPLQVFLGNGHGDFQEIANPLLSLPASPSQILLGDFNNDGKPDIALSQYQLGVVYLLTGDGQGKFQVAQRLDFGPNGFTQIAAGDWDNDGILDLVVRNSRGDSDTYLTFFFGNGTGLLARGSELRYTKPRLVGTVTPADVDGDGNLDLLVGLDDQTIVLLLGDGRGGFAPSPGGPVGQGYSAIAADWNGDGRTDMIVRGLEQFAIYLGNKAQSVVALTQDPPNPFTIGQTVSLTAIVTAPPGAFRAPTGSFSLYDGNSLLNTAPSVDGTARFVTKYVPGLHRFAVVYNGDDRFGSAEVSLAVIETGVPNAIQSLGTVQPFQVRVTDANGNPVAGVGVIFTAPSIGPSGVFGTGLTTQALTDGNGVATAVLFTPNTMTGAFTIAVTVSGYPNVTATISQRN